MASPITKANIQKEAIFRPERKSTEAKNKKGNKLINEAAIGKANCGVNPRQINGTAT